MIDNYHLYHGAALSIVTEAQRFGSIARINDLPLGAYAINHDIGIFIKHTTNDRSPWHFNFHPEHQTAVRRLFDKYDDRAYVVLVCGKAGICVLKYGEYAAVLDENFTDQENLTVSRPSGGSFRISGALGKYKKAIALNRFPRILFK